MFFFSKVGFSNIVFSNIRFQQKTKHGLDMLGF
jgi:hypothetical protein